MRHKLFFPMFLVLSFGVVSIFAQAGGEPAETRPLPKIISGGVVNGKATSLPKPAYPATARAVQASGAVNVQVTIDEQGNVISATAVSGHPLLRAAAVEAAWRAKFPPTLLQGQPARVTGVIVYNFIPSNNNLSKLNSEVLFPLTISMFLTSLKEIPPDEEVNDILRGLSSALPANYKIDKRQFERLIRANQNERVRIIDELVSSMKNEVGETEGWIIDFGKYWGTAIGQAFTLTTNNYQGDRKVFTKNLESMNWILESPPADIPADILKKIRAIAAYNNETDMISPEFIKDFLNSSLEFLEYIIKQSGGK